MALLEVQDLYVEFSTRGKIVYAVNGVSFSLEAGETLGIVGESGSGKSVTALAMLGILPKPAGRVAGGSVTFDGTELLGRSDDQMRRIRGKDIAMVFQDPMTSLNPVLTVGRQLTEALRAHLDLSKAEAVTEAASLLERVGIPDGRSRLRQFPHQFSGGMRQRVMIAMAIACKPKILIADEPTTALDVTIQAQILDLLRQLVAEEQMALILVTHDLGVVAGICNRTNVMYAGALVETAPTSQLFSSPRHPYTVGLLQSVPRLDAERTRRLEPIAGAPTTPTEPPSFCSFAPRCKFADDRSRSEVPILEPIGPDHHVACFNPVPEAELVRAGIGDPHPQPGAGA